MSVPVTVKHMKYASDFYTLRENCQKCRIQQETPDNRLHMLDSIISRISGNHQFTNIIPQRHQLLSSQFPIPFQLFLVGRPFPQFAVTVVTPLVLHESVSNKIRYLR